MPLHRKSLKIVCYATILLSILTSCSSELQTIYRAPATKYEKLGEVIGTSTGSLGILTTDAYFIPMGLNSRVERAYINAILQAPGATALVDVTYKEDWYWWIIGTARRVTITGQAIKEIK